MGWPLAGITPEYEIIIIIAPASECCSYEGNILHRAVEASFFLRVIESVHMPLE